MRNALGYFYISCAAGFTALAVIQGVSAFSQYSPGHPEYITGTRHNALASIAMGMIFLALGAAMLSYGIRILKSKSTEATQPEEGPSRNQK